MQNAMSMSTLFTVLHFGRLFFEKLFIHLGDYIDAFHLPILFQSFITSLFFRTDKRLDGEEEIRLVRGDNFNSYVENLTNLSIGHSKEVMKCIKAYKS